MKYIFLLFLLSFIALNDSCKNPTPTPNPIPIIVDSLTFPTNFVFIIPNTSGDSTHVFTLYSETDSIRLDAIDTKQVTEDSTRKIYDVKLNGEFTTRCLDSELIEVKMTKLDSSVNIDLNKTQNEYSQSLKGFNFSLRLDSLLLIKIYGKPHKKH